MRNGTDDVELVRRFVETFDRLDEMVAADDAMLTGELDAGVCDDDWCIGTWRPAAVSTPARALDVVRNQIGQALPTLYEQLVLSYRWLEVDLHVCRLLANAPGIGLEPLAAEMFRDPVMNTTLIPARMLRFAMASESYDPVCFDLTRFHDGDCPVVQLNHESILCDDAIGDVRVLFRTFRELVTTVIGLGSWEP